MQMQCLIGILSDASVLEETKRYRRAHESSLRYLGSAASFYLSLFAEAFCQTSLYLLNFTVMYLAFGC